MILNGTEETNREIDTSHRREIDILSQKLIKAKEEAQDYARIADLRGFMNKEDVIFFIYNNKKNRSPTKYLLKMVSTTTETT